jgi:excisionase family DNA binding protein
VSALSWLAPEAQEEIRALVRAEVESALAAQRTEPKRWLTAAEAGAYLGCSPRAVYMRIKRGRVPAGAVRHHGRRVLVDREALDRQLEDGL